VGVRVAIARIRGVGGWRGGVAAIVFERGWCLWMIGGGIVMEVRMR